MKHEFVLWYLALIVCWGILGLLIANAQVSAYEFDLEANLTSLNATNDTGEMQQASLTQGVSLIDAFVGFNTDYWYINLIFLITGPFAIWVLAATILPGG